MRYPSGMAVGAATLLAVLCSALFEVELPSCLALGVCAGLAVDFAISALRLKRQRLCAGSRQKGQRLPCRKPLPFCSSGAYMSLMQYSIALTLPLTMV